MTRPVAPHAFSMRLTEGLFAHWPFEPELLRPQVPDPLELDTYEGRAWVTLVPFVLADAGLRFSPSFARLTFPELNVRTYVRFDDTPGLYFFSVDVASRVLPSIVRAATEIDCHRASIDVDRHAAGVDFRLSRAGSRSRPAARFDASYRHAGAVFRADSGTLDYWLSERRRMFDFAGGRVIYADIAHEPWPLQPAHATLRQDSLLEVNGLPAPTGDPRVRYTSGLTLTGSIPRRVDSMDGGDRIRPPGLRHR